MKLTLLESLMTINRGNVEVHLAKISDEAHHARAGGGARVASVTSKDHPVIVTSEGHLAKVSGEAHLARVSGEAHLAEVRGSPLTRVSGKDYHAGFSDSPGWGSVLKFPMLEAAVPPSRFNDGVHFLQ